MDAARNQDDDSHLRRCNGRKKNRRVMPLTSVGANDGTPTRLQSTSFNVPTAFAVIPRGRYGKERERNGSWKPSDSHIFDCAYIDHEVAYHKRIFDALDTTLIRACKVPSSKPCRSRYDLLSDRIRSTRRSCEAA